MLYLLNIQPFISISKEHLQKYLYQIIKFASLLTLITKKEGVSSYEKSQ